MINDIMNCRFGEKMRALIAYDVGVSATLDYANTTVLTPSQDSPIDFNDLTTPGNFRIGGSTYFQYMINTPYGNNSENGVAGRLFVCTTIGNARFLQIYVESSRLSKIFKRYYHGTGWTKWTEIATTDSANTIANEILHFYSTNLLPPAPSDAGTTPTGTGVTFVSDGNGNYTITGNQTGATATAMYDIYSSASSLPDGMKPGGTYKLRVAMDVQATCRVQYTTNGSSWASIADSMNDVVFTVPSGAIGLRVRFVVPYGTKYTENLVPSSCHPEIVEVDSVASLTPPAQVPRKMLTIIDDDGHGLFYSELLPIVQEKHVPITSAVICARIDNHATYSSYMTWEQVQNSYLSGADIISHTFTHTTPEVVISSGMTLAQLVEDYQKAFNDLSVHGIPSPGLVFNNDSAKYGKQQQAAKRGYDYAFSNQKTGTIAEVINHRGGTAPYNILRYDITPTSGTIRTLAELKEMIDTLVTAGEGWLIWMTHTSDGDWPGDGSEGQKLSDALDYAIAQGVEIVTCEQGARYVLT